MKLNKEVCHKCWKKYDKEDHGYLLFDKVWTKFKEVVCPMGLYHCPYVLEHMVSENTEEIRRT